MKVSRKGRRAMAVGAAKSDMKRGMKARWSDHKGRRGEAVGMAERALIDKWHREKESDRKAKPGPHERAARSGRMAHHTSHHHRDLYDRLGWPLMSREGGEGPKCTIRFRSLT